MTEILEIERLSQHELHLHTSAGDARIGLLGGQVLSWIPAQHTEVFWITPTPAPSPAPLRGGVPICWPWFARQGVPEHLPQHGPARLVPWRVVDQEQGLDQVTVRISPQWERLPAADVQALEAALGVSLTQLKVVQTITLGQGLTQCLETRYTGPGAVVLTQAFHSYFAVADAAQVQISGLQGLVYRDKLEQFKEVLQSQAFRFDQACDRIYTDAKGRYQLIDPNLRRRILISSSGSRSVVVWNPGQQAGSTIADVGSDQSRRFFCVEVSNAQPDQVVLAQGQSHMLSQHLSVEMLDPAQQHHG